MERRARRSEPEREPGLFDAPPPASPPPSRSSAPQPDARADAPTRPAPPPAPAAKAPPPLYRVTQLSAALQGRLSELGGVRVEGEVSQKKRAAAGHVYFDLKDAGAKLACKVWQSNAARVLRFELAEGAQVIAWGRLDVYAP